MTELTDKQAQLCEENTTDFSDLRAFFISCTLKRSPEVSNTEGLAEISMEIMRRNGVAVDLIRAVDRDIATGVWPDMTEHGWDKDEWPADLRAGDGRRHPRAALTDLARREVVGVHAASSSGSTATPASSTTPASTRTTAASAAASSPATRTASSTAR